jgi:hypothetical protein
MAMTGDEYQTFYRLGTRTWRMELEGNAAVARNGVFGSGRVIIFYLKSRTKKTSMKIIGGRGIFAA